MPISLQSDAILPQGHILVDGQRVVSFSTTGGLSATTIRANEYVGIGSIPVGAVLAFAHASPPTGWLLCNGAAISRNTYSGLFTVIGTTYGVGDNSTTFNIPDYRGSFLRGHHNGSNRDPDFSTRALGSLQIDEFESHRHIVNREVIFFGVGNLGTGAISQPTDNPPNSTISTQLTGGAETRPVNNSVNYYIKF